MDIFLTLLLLAGILLFAVLAGRNLKNGIYAVIFLMPAYLIRFTILGIPTTFLEILIYLLFLAWLGRSREKIRLCSSVSLLPQKDQRLFLGISLLFLGVLFSTLHSADLRTSLGVLKGWFLDPFLFFLVYIGSIREEKDIRRSLVSFVLSAAGVALLASLYALGGVLTFDGRLRAFYESPNYLAMCLAPACLGAVYLFAFNKNLKEKNQMPVGLSLRGAEQRGNPEPMRDIARFFAETQDDRRMQIALLSLLVVVILLTRSYGAVLGLAVALSLFFFKKYAAEKTKFGKKNIRALLALVALMLVLFSSLSYQKYEQLVLAGERSSLSSRVMIWEAAGAMLADSPFFGIGPGTFQATYLSYQGRFPTPYLEWAVPQPHNTFLAFYLEAGLLGFVGFLLLLSWLAGRASRNDLVFLFLAYFFVHSLVDTLYWKNDLSLLFWLVLGVAYAGKKKQP